MWKRFLSIERVKTNVEKEVGDKDSRAYHLDGVKVDEDFRRYYPLWVAGF